MASSEKRCLYEVLGLNRDCTADEIRSAYRKLALQRHPDKLVKSGVSESDATAAFQELANAYEVLSEPRERAWYDSHRSQILFSGSNSSSNSSAIVPDLFNYFSNSVFSGYSDTGKGFFKVYAEVFDKIYRNELNFAKKLGLGVVKEAPLMGNLESPYEQVNAFYGYWLGFVTVMDFVWADQYDAMAGPNRKSRRVMEEENKKIRKKASREYTDTVRGLAKFVKKRDKRVIDMQVKRNEEMERKNEEEKERKRVMQKEKAERARMYEEPEWAKAEEEEDEVVEEEGERKEELYCVACGKKFKSDKQWKNHAQSKKHKENVAELREAFGDEDRENEEEEEEEEILNGDVNADGVDKLQSRFGKGVGIHEQEEDDDDNDQESQSTEEETADVDNGGGLKEVAEKLGLEEDDDDESSMLEAMSSGHKSRKNVGTKHKLKTSSKKAHVEVEPEEIDLMEYNSRKGSRRNRGGRKERGKRADEEDKEDKKVDMAETSSKAVEDNNGNDNASRMEEPSSSRPLPENENDSKGENERSGRSKVSKQAVDKKVTSKKDANAKLKNAPKGRNQKATSRTSSGHECDTCGEDFESRNKLHKHLSDTGHASLKSR